ncbi:type I-B CRISPR-associated protein Cas5b [Megamonas funiformis]|jgi:CRISPR-associated protein Cas5h|uniref:type I-B CRISPR-associated protein Cas5b n=1 Tax=Megamonas funiformis TaxID=437897 RepID=UPI000E4A9997|nr:type I-B CRISPR-associated protein Cas5b [Megamonas funiformis]MCX4129874.1 type I-B CRISPR-associated protein Cas5b [Megamonas funiformis]RHG12196.1 type I-B CRISPR-associated protein Cas5 [Megamonas funiformis]
MEILKFKLSGKSAFFKKPEVNTYCYFTYGNIHRIALLGILGAILGYKGYSQMKDILSIKEEIDLKPAYPEFYEKLKELKIAILPLNPKGVITKKIQIFNNSTGAGSKELDKKNKIEYGVNLIVKEQWLENPKWEICILLDCEEAKKIKEAIQNHKCKFYPYLGTNDHFADIEYLGVEEAKTIEDDMYRIDSFVFRDDVDILDLEREELEDWKSQGKPMPKGIFKYEEALPYDINEITNNYKLQRFVYTGNLVELEEDRKVYHIQDKNKKEIEDKYIIFY